MPVRHTIKYQLQSEAGQSLIEFAITLPLLLLMFLGTVEISRYALIIQKLENTANTVTDVTTQASPNSGPLSSAQMGQLMSAAQIMMNPYAFASSGRIIVTDVTQPGSGSPKINWQYCGGGTLAATSKIGTTIGGVATLPSGFTMIAGEEVVIGEIFYNFVPVTTSPWTVLSASTIYRTAIFMPRLGALTGFSSTCS